MALKRMLLTSYMGFSGLVEAGLAFLARSPAYFTFNRKLKKRWLCTLIERHSADCSINGDHELYGVLLLRGTVVLILGQMDLNLLGLECHQVWSHFGEQHALETILVLSGSLHTSSAGNAIQRI